MMNFDFVPIRFYIKLNDKIVGAIDSIDTNESSVAVWRLLGLYMLDYWEELGRFSTFEEVKENIGILQKYILNNK